MKSSGMRIGFWASVTAALSLIVFTISFIAIAMTQEVTMWTNLADHLEKLRSNSQTNKYIAQVCALLFGLAYLIIISIVNNIAAPAKKVFAKISLSFATIFTTLIAINYFLQLTFVRFSIQSGLTDNLDNWIMFNPHSIILAIAMLGWTIMFGLSSLFVAPVFEGRGISKTIRVLFIINGVFCLLGGVGFVRQSFLIVNLTINMGMGGTMTALSVVLSRYFWGSEKSIE